MTNYTKQIELGIRCAADIIRSSKKVVALTGAGISTPSGIPDFRSTKNGLWEKVDPFEVASLAAFRYDPEKFFSWIRPLTETLFRANPNLAHLGLAELEKAGFIQTIITQNIDMLHQRAGSKHVLEVHGSWSSLTCVNCFHKEKADKYMEAFLKNGEIPRCPKCGGILKPDLILFGEQLPSKIWLTAQQEAKQCDVMIVAGSSLEVLPVAGLPMRALENGARLIIINHSETYIDVRADVVIHEDVAEIIPLITQAVMEN